MTAGRRRRVKCVQSRRAALLCARAHADKYKFPSAEISSSPRHAGTRQRTARAVPEEKARNARSRKEAANTSAEDQDIVVE